MDTEIHGLIELCRAHLDDLETSVTALDPTKKHAMAAINGGVNRLKHVEKQLTLARDAVFKYAVDETELEKA